MTENSGSDVLRPFSCRACGMIVPLDVLGSEETKNGIYEAVAVQKFRLRPDATHPKQLWCGACREEFALLHTRGINITADDFETSRKRSGRSPGEPLQRINNLACQECRVGPAVYELSATGGWTLTCKYPPCGFRVAFDDRGRRISAT